MASVSHQCSETPVGAESSPTSRFLELFSAIGIGRHAESSRLIDGKLESCPRPFGLRPNTHLFGTGVPRQKSKRPINAPISNLVKAVDLVAIGLRNLFSG